MTYLRKINPYVFEELILTSFENKGYKIIRNKSYSNDGGIDGKILLDGKLYIIQAKRYSNSVKSQHIVDLKKKVQDSSATGGIFVHTGTTSAKSYDLYRYSEIQIISGSKLVELILAIP